MEEFDSIFKRKSIRNYSEEKIPKKKREEIQRYISKISPLYEPNVESKILDRQGEVDKLVKGWIKNFGKIKSPHYLITVGEEGEGYLENIGFVFERAILKMTSMDIGTCWLGTNFDKEKLKKRLDLDESWKIPTIIAMGYPEGENNFRKNLSEFNRKNIEEIIIGETENIPKDWKNILNVVRLSPSAMNGQPWRFEFSNNQIHLFIEKGNILKKAFKKFSNLSKLQRIDAGICLSHLKVACENFDKDIEFSNEKKEKDRHTYITTIREK